MRKWPNFNYTFQSHIGTDIGYIDESLVTQMINSALRGGPLTFENVSDYLHWVLHVGSCPLPLYRHYIGDVQENTIVSAVRARFSTSLLIFSISHDTDRKTNSAKIYRGFVYRRSIVHRSFIAITRHTVVSQNYSDEIKFNMAIKK